MRVRDLIKKENAVYSFAEINSGIKKSMLESGLLAFVSVVIGMLFVIIFRGMEIKALLMLLLFPTLMFGLFVWATLYAYWTGRTGDYLVYQGTCVDSEYSLNPLLKAKNTAFQRRTRFVMENEDGRLFRVLCKRPSDLPKEGATVQLIVSRNTPMYKEELCELLTNYISITSISTAKTLAKTAKKSKKA